MNEKDRNIDKEQAHPNALLSGKVKDGRTGADVLRDFAEQLRQRAYAIDMIANGFPEKMSPEADATFLKVAHTIAQYSSFR